MAQASATLNDPSASHGPRSASPGRRTRANVLGAASVSGAIVALLLLFVPWPEVGRLWRGLSPLPLLAAVGTIGLGHLATAFRIRTMVPAGVAVALRDGVVVSAWHGLAMIALPVRLGELALVEALSRYGHVARGIGLAVLLVQRIYDALLACAAFGFGAYGAMLGRPPFVLLAAAVLGLLALSRRLDSLLGWLAARCAGFRGAGRRLHALLVDTRDGVRATSRDRAPVLALGTMLFWSTEFVALWLIFRAFGTSLDTFTTLFLAAGLALVYALPLPTIGGLGLAEGGLAALLAAAGWPAELALGLGVSVRLTLLALHALVVAVLLPALALPRGGR